MRQTLLIAGIILLLAGCQKRFDIASLPPADSFTTIGDTAYVQKEVWSGSFNKPRTVMVGLDQLIYVTDTYNNRIVMLNQAGQILSVSKFVLHPLAITQDLRLDLLVTAETVEPTTLDTIGVVLRIKLVAANHDLGAAAIDTVWREPARPKRRFVGIGIILNDEFLVARDGPDNASVVDPDARILRFRHLPNAVGKKDTFITPLGELQTGAGSAVTFINHPTGLATFPNSGDFVVVQSADGVQYSAVWMVFTKNSDFEGWLPKYDPSDPNQRTDFVAPNRFRNAVGVGIDRIKRDIFIVDNVDAQRDSIVKFNSRGRFKRESFGSLTEGISLSMPGGVAVSGSTSEDYTLYVCDTGNDRIILYRLNQ